jgi:hypothetical protein
MTVVIVMDWEETEADYFEIVSRMGVQGTPAEGIHLHVAGPTTHGIRIVEVWEELAGFEAFVRGVLLPTAEAAGIATKPTYASFPVANLFAPGLEVLEKVAQRFAQ